MDELFNKEKIKIFFLSILTLEIASFWSYLFPFLENIFFCLIAIAFLFLCVKNLRLGFLVLVAEILIGSKGYLFYFNSLGPTISIRIIFWVILLAVFFAQTTKDYFIYKKNIFLIFDFKKNRILLYTYILFACILFSVVNAIIRSNNFNNVFFDANAWFFFTLLFPAIYLFKTKDDIKDVFAVFTASLLWLVTKTFFILYIFSHQFEGFVYPVYRWVRTTGVGEVTLVQGGFYRVFFQSHIFILLAFFVFMLLFFCHYENKNWKKNPKKLLIYFLWCSLLFSVIIISFSRSFWLGSLTGLFFAFIYFLFKYKFKKTIAIAAISLFMFVVSIGTISIIVKFPWPPSIGGFNTVDLISKRSKTISNEAAVSSRWALLPKLLNEIKESPVLGKGFGATVTYKSQDPRVLAANPDGKYTTYAFEWGWLDVWFKLGFFGLVIYLVLIIYILHTYFSKIKIIRTHKTLYTSLIIGLVVLCVVHFFTPYLNHPLGIAYLILMIVLSLNLAKS